MVGRPTGDHVTEPRSEIFRVIRLPRMTLMFFGDSILSAFSVASHSTPRKRFAN